MLFTESKSTTLGSTNELTRVSAEVVRNIMMMIEANKEEWQEAVIESQTSHDAMDQLIFKTKELETVDTEFLKAEAEDVTERMLKSQQSKRSRLISKEMTKDNYMSYMTGAVAENLIRLAINKPKTSGGGGSKRATISYSEEEYEQLANDQEALKRAIRNVQSKKSIERRKDDFDESSDRWKEIVDTEERLKALRDGSSKEAEKAIETNLQINELLADTDVKGLKAAEAKDLLDRIKQMLAAKEEETTEEVELNVG